MLWTITSTIHVHVLTHTTTSTSHVLTYWYHPCACSDSPKHHPCAIMLLTHVIHVRCSDSPNTIHVPWYNSPITTHVHVLTHLTPSMCHNVVDPRLFHVPVPCSDSHNPCATTSKSHGFYRQVGLAKTLYICTVYIGLARTLYICNVYIGLARTLYICTVYIGWPEPCIYTVYDRILGDFPAKHTVCALYVQKWFWPTLYTCICLCAQLCTQTRL